MSQRGGCGSVVATLALNIALPGCACSPAGDVILGSGQQCMSKDKKCGGTVTVGDSVCGRRCSDVAKGGGGDTAAVNRTERPPPAGEAGRPAPHVSRDER